jgi:CheY-like chemotaxis protein
MGIMTDARAPQVYVVDDDPRVLRSIGRLLSAWGIDCRTFGDGRSALAAMRTDRPEMLLVDMFMPEMDGFEVMAETRRISPDTRIVATSGDMVEGHPTHVLEASECLGVVATIAKPIDPEHLRTLIGQVLEDWSAGAPAGTP